MSLQCFTHWLLTIHILGKLLLRSFWLNEVSYKFRYKDKLPNRSRLLKDPISLLSKFFSKFVHPGGQFTNDMRCSRRNPVCLDQRQFHNSLHKIPDWWLQINTCFAPVAMRSISKLDYCWHLLTFLSICVTALF